MRISQEFSQATFLRNLSQARESMNSALAQMSSGKRVVFASDDPQAASRIGRLTEDAQRLAVRQRMFSQTRPWFQLTEQAVTDLGDQLLEARKLAIQGSSEEFQGDQMRAIASQVAGLAEQVEALTRLRIGGRFVFSGTLTSVEPYDDAGRYQGNSGEIRLPLDDGTVIINIPGDQIFGEIGTGGARDLLDRLEAALLAEDHSAVQALIDPLSAAIADNSATLAKIGTRRQVLEDADVRVAEREISIEQAISNLADADMARAISDASKFDVVTQATLGAGTRLFGPSFFDFIG